MNNQHSTYFEIQRLSQWWIWLIITAVSAVIGIGAYAQLILKEPIGNNPMSDTGLLFFLGFWLLFLFFFFGISLKTEINLTHISLRFIPFLWKQKHIAFSDLKQLYLRRYSPMVEYGGWGLRYSLTGNGKAYTISGKIGLQLEFKDGKRLLIGIKQEQELQQILKEVYKKYPELQEKTKG